MVAALLLCGTVAAADLRAVPPDGMVRLSEAITGIEIEPRYGTSDNFTGAPLPGYGAPQLWLKEPVARALAHVHAGLADQGLGLRVYDAYRPRRASEAMVAWTHRTDQAHLLRDGYIAARSGHNHGHTVDLTLVHRATGEAVDMGGAWDTFSAVSHHTGASGPAQEARETLRQAMVAAGFVPYDKEWWHFRFPLKGTVPLDLPYGCHEPQRFVPPAGWTAPDWIAPVAPAPSACPSPTPP